MLIMSNWLHYQQKLREESSVSAPKAKHSLSSVSKGQAYRFLLSGQKEKHNASLPVSSFFYFFSASSFRTVKMYSDTALQTNECKVCTDILYKDHPFPFSKLMTYVGSWRLYRHFRPKKVEKHPGWMAQSIGGLTNKFIQTSKQFFIPPLHLSCMSFNT